MICRYIFVFSVLKRTISLDAGRKLSVRTYNFRTSSERLMYVYFTVFVQGKVPVYSIDLQQFTYQ